MWNIKLPDPAVMWTRRRMYACLKIIATQLRGSANFSPHINYWNIYYALQEEFNIPFPPGPVVPFAHGSVDATYAYDVLYYYAQAKVSTLPVWIPSDRRDTWWEWNNEEERLLP